MDQGPGVSKSFLFTKKVENSISVDVELGLLLFLWKEKLISELNTIFSPEITALFITFCSYLTGFE